MASRLQLPRRAIVVLAMLGLTLGCAEPLVGFAGGQLSGQTAPPPRNWSFSDEFETVQLETRPADPYSVNIWGMASGRNYFIASGKGMEAAWAQHIAEDPRVRLRIGDTVYELRAVRVDGKLDRRRFTALGRHKYDDFDSAFDEFETAVVFRLDPR